MFVLHGRYFRYFDWLSFSIVCALSIIGLLFILSATYIPEQPYSFYYKKQLIGCLFGFIIYGLLCLADYRVCMRWAYFSYVALLALLAFTLVKGSIGMGAQRWINLFFFKIQPSELAKILFPGFASYHLYSYKNTDRFYFSDFIPIIVMLGISFILIKKQPDLGTALIVVFVGFFFLWLAGMSRWIFISGFLFCVLAAPLLWQCLKPYQKNRIEVFLGAGQSNKERYQIEQAAIAIGSGGLLGKGFLQGTQNKLNFLPASRTDFIFAVISEEWGFAGALMIIILYCILFLRMCTTIQRMNDSHSKLLASSVIAHVLFSTIINIAMALGMLPIVGIPLPFISYGLCNLWVTFASFGWIQGIYMQHAYVREYASAKMLT